MQLCFNHYMANLYISKMFIKISDYKIFTLKSLFSFKNIKRGVFLLSKIRIKNSAGADMHIGKLLIYFSD